MRKAAFFLVLLMLCTIFPTSIFADGRQVKTKTIGNDTYVSLEEIKDALGFSYEKAGTDSIVVRNEPIKNVLKKVNESVVAIIGEDKKVDPDLVNDYYYSKMPAALTHGSGVIVSKDGRIITNNHVVENMKEIYVVLYNKKAFKAKLLYKNKDLDLALIKIDCSTLKPIEFEKMENISAGDEVIAIGAPLYLNWSNSVSKGIISGLNRPVDQTYTFLQTDASINPGNSGGPLINMNGKLVGINTLVVLAVDGISFSIPVENVQYLIEQYNKYGKIRRAYTGFELEESWLAMVGIPSDQGLKVIGLKSDAIVQNTVVKEGDILESIDGNPVTSIASYNEVLKKMIPGQTVKLKFSRNDSVFTINVKLKEYPEENSSDE